MMTRREKRDAYKKWFYTTFSEDEITLLESYGVEFDGDYRFSMVLGQDNDESDDDYNIDFKNEPLELVQHIDNYKFRKNLPELHEKFIDRYITFVPNFIRKQIDRDMLKNDKYYCAWFCKRYCFFQHAEEVKVSTTDRTWVKWYPIIDNRTPKECHAFEGKKFDPHSEEFKTLAEEHWSTIRHGCRCGLGLTKPDKK